MDVFVAGVVPNTVVEALEALDGTRRVAAERDVAAALDRLAGKTPDCVVVGRTPVPARTVVRRVRTHTSAPVVVVADEPPDLPPDVAVAPSSSPERVATRVADALADSELDRLQRRYRRVQAAVGAVRSALDGVETRSELDQALTGLAEGPTYRAAWTLRRADEGDDILQPAAAVGVPESALATVSVEGDRAVARAHREGALVTDADGSLTTVAVPIGSDTVLVLVAPISEVPVGEREALESLAERVESLLNGDPDGLTVLGDTLAHELANHLELAGTYLELAEERGDATDFEQVAEALRRIGRVRDDARSLARGDLDMEPIDLATVAQSAWESHESEATLTVTDGALRADRGLLELCFENLFRNARTYGGDDVSVTVEPFETGFTVSDDGPGIPEENRESVLAWGTGEGSGVGLGIVSLVAERHGWSVTIEESESGGAKFVVA